MGGLYNQAITNNILDLGSYRAMQMEKIYCYLLDIHSAMLI